MTSCTQPGCVTERAKLAPGDLRGASVRAVQRLAEGRSHNPLPHVDTVALTRSKVEPMVRGLFQRAEQETVLVAIEKSVVFVTCANIEDLLHAREFDSTAWTLANLYLESAGAALLADDALRLVGLSEETTCYGSPECFAENDEFADFIVLEVAHIFHNCERATIGLNETRTTEWLPDIDTGNREVFANACELKHTRAMPCLRSARPSDLRWRS